MTELVGRLADLAPRAAGDRVAAFLDELLATGDVVAGKVNARAPVQTYPDEWSFGALRDAALFLLRLVRRAREEGAVCTSGSAYDVQFDGTRPVFTAPWSFRPRMPGEGWPGSAAFSRTFLVPLFLTAECGVPFQRLMRECPPDGIPTALVELVAERRRRSLRVSPKATDHRPSPAHWASGEYAHGDAAYGTADRFEEVVLSFDERSATHDDGPLRRLRARWREDREDTADVAQARTRFVHAAAERRGSSTAIDLSSGDDRHAWVAGDCSLVVVPDGDHRRADELYRSSRGQPAHEWGPKVLPLVADASTLDAAPTAPGAGSGRAPLLRRVDPDLVVAVVHGSPPGDEPALATAQANLRRVIHLAGSARAAAVLEVDRDRVGHVERMADHEAMAVARCHPVPGHDRTLVELVPRWAPPGPGPRRAAPGPSPPRPSPSGAPAGPQRRPTPRRTSSTVRSTRARSRRSADGRLVE